MQASGDESAPDDHHDHHDEADDTNVGNAGDRKYDHAQHIVRDGQRQEKDPQWRRDQWSRQREHTQGEGNVGRHGYAPAPVKGRRVKKLS